MAKALHCADPSLGLQVDAKKNASLPILLPHEVVYKLVADGETRLWEQGAMGQQALRQLLQMQDDHQCTAIALSVWMDGTPCNWDRSQSLETICFGFPGLGGANSSLRIPITVINKKHCVKWQTMDSILAVVAWSMQCMGAGFWPSKNHLGEAFGPQERQRTRMANTSLGYRAFLVEVKGDWALLADVFRFPSWRSKDGCCWLCNVKPSTLHDFSSTAPWRQTENRLSHWQVLSGILAKGQQVSPLFSSPGVTAQTFAIDWMHCGDLGVSADYLGNLFYHITGGRADACAELYLKIRSYYQKQPCTSKLDTLTPSMLRKNGKTSPKLRGKAAEIRYLVPFGAELAQEVFTDPSDSVGVTIRQAAQHLASAYSCLQRDVFNPQMLKESSTRFLLLCNSLASMFGPALWRIKPKHHLFAELCSMGCNPSMSWNYREEDFGGSMAAMSRRRGGVFSAGTAAQNVLNKFRAQHPLKLRT